VQVLYLTAAEHAVAEYTGEGDAFELAIREQRVGTLAELRIIEATGNEFRFRHASIKRGPVELAIDVLVRYIFKHLNGGVGK
jgi:hypothetical protein